MDNSEMLQAVQLLHERVTMLENIQNTKMDSLPGFMKSSKIWGSKKSDKNDSEDKIKTDLEKKMELKIEDLKQSIKDEIKKEVESHDQRMRERMGQWAKIIHGMKNEINTTIESIPDTVDKKTEEQIQKQIIQFKDEFREQLTNNVNFYLEEITDIQSQVTDLNQKRESITTYVDRMFNSFAKEWEGCEKRIDEKSEAMTKMFDGISSLVKEINEEIKTKVEPYQDKVVSCDKRLDFLESIVLRRNKDDEDQTYHRDRH